MRPFARGLCSTGTLGLLVCAVWLLAPASVRAAVPGEINFQGLLLDSGGQPVNGLVDLVFRLYASETGGTALWTEGHTDVDVLDGVYDVALGSVTPLTPTVLGNATLYLEIDVEGETLAPRQRLLAVPYAVRSGSADAVGGLSSGFATEIFEHFNFDGGGPPNDHPSEGLADVDADGIANFVDPDNDGDGLSDIDEVAQASDINLVTPVITGFAPPTADGFITTTVQVQGQNFESGLTVVFGSQSPSPTNLTPTSFDVDVGPQPPGSVAVDVTLPNGESDSASFSFFFIQPTITGFDPATADGDFTTTVQVNGTNFQPGLSVVFGSQSPSPTKLTPTSFDVDVGPQPPGSVAVDVTLPNGESDSSSFTFFINQPVITGFDPPIADPDETTTVEVQGQDFLPGLTVVFGSETPTPMNLTPTSFEVDVGPQAPGTVSVVVTLPNGRSDSAEFAFLDEKRVFVTSQLFEGNLGGLAGADALCNSLAAAAGRSEPFVAWLADSSQHPAGRFDQDGGPYRLYDGTVIADDWADLIDGALDAPIDRTEMGPASGAIRAWTNVQSNGTSAGSSHCADWSSDSALGRVGDRTASDGTWTDKEVDFFCGSLARLYCFEE